MSNISKYNTLIKNLIKPSHILNHNPFSPSFPKPSLIQLNFLTFINNINPSSSTKLIFLQTHQTTFI